MIHDSHAILAFPTYVKSAEGNLQKSSSADVSKCVYILETVKAYTSIYVFENMNLRSRVEGGYGTSKYIMIHLL